jgi:multidrug efflux pump subunit AcrA (membrane-fusion protein)
MTQHIMIIWIATAVATFSGLVGSFNARGVIEFIRAEEGQSVKSGQLLRIAASVDGVVIGLADRDAVRTHLGDAARIEFDAWPGRVFAGRVSNISSAADSGTCTFTVEVQIDAGAA